MMAQGPAYDKFNFLCETEAIAHIGGPEFHPNAVVQNAIIHRVKGRPSQNRPCLVYFHGGGAMMCSAETYIPLMNRYAVESDVTVINVNYRLIPESPAPKGLFDAYANLKDILMNHVKYGIDPKRVAIFGESGGGYICAGVGVLLAEKNEGGLVRFQMQ